MEAPTRRRRVPENPAIERLPPYDLESEQCVLGCILLSPMDSMSMCSMRIQSSEAFYDIRHQKIYGAMQGLYNNRKPIDIITLSTALKEIGELERIGSAAYLSNLADMVPSAMNLEFYLKTVVDKAMLRKMISFCTESVGKAYEANGEIGALVDSFETGAMGVRDAFTNSMASEFCSIEAEQEELENDYDAASINKTPSGILTGYADYDRITGGLFSPDMVVLAARPSVGKTSLAMNIIQNLTITKSTACGIFSLEMSGKQLIHRLACGIARVPSNAAFTGNLEEEQREALNNAHEMVREAKNRICICDVGGLSIDELSARARRMVMFYDIKVLLVDYLQLMRGHARANNRQEAVAAISNGIKALAKELKLPIISLCQLNREVDKDKKGREPRISDLRESGAIEQDADLVWFLHPVVEDIENQTVEMKWIISKNRNGRTGSINLLFFKPFTRFDSSAKIDERDVPK